MSLPCYFTEFYNFVGFIYMILMGFLGESCKNPLNPVKMANFLGGQGEGSGLNMVHRMFSRTSKLYLISSTK